MSKRPMVSDHSILDRRNFLKRAAALGMYGAGVQLASTMAFPTSARAADLALTMFVFSGGEQGTVAKEVVGKFLKENPAVKIDFYEESNAVAYPKIRAARSANPDKPLVNFGYFNANATAMGDQDGMWLSLDAGKIPNLNDISPTYRRRADHGVGHSISPIGIAYNKEKVKTPPKSWSDIWSNTEYKGRVILFDYLWPYTGVIQAAKENGGSEADLEPGMKLWAKHTDQILALVTSTQQAQNLLARGDAWVTIWAKGNVQQWADAGVPVEFVVPKEGVIAFPLFFQMLAGSTPEQQDVASKIINALLEPAALARWCELNGVAPTSSKVQLPARMASDPAYSKDAVANAIQLDWPTLARKDAEYREKWDRIVKTQL
jgi:putative spermidine/putrescine transport system substrate-binding protein